MSKPELDFTNKSIEELLFMAQVNFKNLTKLVPGLDKHPIYILAQAQLDAAIKEIETEDE